MRTKQKRHQFATPSVEQTEPLSVWSRSVCQKEQDFG